MPDENGRSEALIGYGTRVYMQATPEAAVLTKIGEVTNVGFPDAEVAEVEVTHYESPDGTREFIAGLADGGSIPLAINWVPGSATSDLLRAAKADRKVRLFRIVTPPAEGSEMFTFPGFINSFPKEAPLDDRMTSTPTIRIAGAVVEAAASADPTVIAA